MARSEASCATSWRSANFMGGLPPAHFSLLMNLLFEKSFKNSLGLNYVRYNIGGGFNPSSSPQLLTKPGEPTFLALPGFKAFPSSPFNWAQDHRQRRVLLAAKKRGADVFEAMSYSPPWWMTVSGDVAGASRKGDSNLAPGNYSAFADYLADVISQYARDPAWNVTFQALEVFNEPLQAWWVKGGRQEGCNFNVTQINALLPIVAAALARKSLTGATALVGVDDLVLTTLRSYADGLFKSPMAASLLNRINVHPYDESLDLATDEVVLGSMRGLAQQLGKEVWVSEWGPWYAQGSDLEVALYTGRIITQHINVLGASGWAHWLAVQWPNAKWGPLRMQWNYTAPFSLFVSKQYWVTMHFSRWITPGSRPIKIEAACQHCVCAAYDAKNRRLVITVTNQQQNPAQMRLDIMGYSSVSSLKGSVLQTYRTSASDSHKLVGSSRLRMPSLISFTSVKQSITTIVVYNVKVPKSGMLIS